MTDQYELIKIIQRSGKCNWRDAVVVAYGPEVYERFIKNNGLEAKPKKRQLKGLK